MVSRKLESLIIKFSKFFTEYLTAFAIFLYTSTHRPRLLNLWVFVCLASLSNFNKLE